MANNNNAHVYFMFLFIMRFIIAFIEAMPSLHTQPKPKSLICETITLCLISVFITVHYITSKLG